MMFTHRHCSLLATVSLLFTLASPVLFYPATAAADEPVEILNPKAKIHRVAQDTEDFFIRLTSNKASVYIGEPVHIHFDVYHLSSLGKQSYDARFPDFLGMKGYEVNIKEFKSSTQKHNNRTYIVEPLGDYYIIPQEPGTIRIPHASIEIPATGEWISSPPLTINVQPLPVKAQKVSIYNTGVFSIHAEMKTPAEVKIGESIRIDIRVKSSTLSNKLHFSAENLQKDQRFITVLPDKPNTYTSTISPGEFTSEGVWSFFMIPRVEGSLTLPQISLETFNPQSHQTEIFKTEPYAVNVQGKTAFAQISISEKMQSTEPAGELRPIRLKQTDNTSRWLPIIATIILSITLIIWLGPVIRRRMQQRRHTKKASLHDIPQMHNDSAAVSEIYKTLESALRQRFKLAPKASPQEVLDAVKAAPLKGMSGEEAMEWLKEMRKSAFSPNAKLTDEQIAWLKRFISALVLFVALCLPMSGHSEENRLSQLENEAATAYQQKQYDKALNKYAEYRTELQKIGNFDEQPDLLYNEGLAYFALKRYPEAYAKFKHASVFVDDENIENNILKTRNIIEQQAYQKDEQTIFLRGNTTAYRSWEIFAQADPGAYVAFMIMALWLLVICIWMRNRYPRILYLFFVSLIGITVFCLLFCCTLIEMNQNRHFAVILDPSNIKSAAHELAVPVNDNAFLTGLTVQVIQTHGTWSQIRRSDKKVAWIPTQQLYPLNLFTKEEP